MTFDEITDQLTDNAPALSIWHGGGANTLDVIALNNGAVSAVLWDDEADVVQLTFTMPTREGEFYALLFGEAMGDNWTFAGREFIDDNGDRVIL
jgi:hypothetical protein